MSDTVPTVFVTTLERPIILTNVLPQAPAVLGDFGIADDVLLAVLSGKMKPQGHLLFALPRSEDTVKKRGSEAPLFPIGFGMEY